MSDAEEFWSIAIEEEPQYLAQCPSHRTLELWSYVDKTKELEYCAGLQNSLGKFPADVRTFFTYHIVFSVLRPLCAQLEKRTPGNPNTIELMEFIIDHLKLVQKRAKDRFQLFLETSEDAGSSLFDAVETFCDAFVDDVVASAETFRVSITMAEAKRRFMKCNVRLLMHIPSTFTNPPPLGWGVLSTYQIISTDEYIVRSHHNTKAEISSVSQHLPVSSQSGSVM